jgi:DedD protein
MDNALKARLIGAAVLVALAVLLIPELLTGHKSGSAGDELAAAAPGTRTFTIELAGSGRDAAAGSASGSAPGAVPAQQAAPPAGATRAAAEGPAPAPRVDEKPADQLPARDAGTAASAPPPPAPEAKASPPAPAARPDAAASSTVRGGWAVQVGAFSSAATASKLATELKSAGYRAYVSPVSKSGKTLQRVRVGPEADRSRAEGIAAKLKARGLPATVVASD